jgi:hypothetical protein
MVDRHTPHRRMPHLMPLQRTPHLMPLQRTPHRMVARLRTAATSTRSNL